MTSVDLSRNNLHAESPEIWLQRTSTSVGVTPVTLPSAFVRFAQIPANSGHKVVPSQV